VTRRDGDGRRSAQKGGWGGQKVGSHHVAFSIAAGGLRKEIGDRLGDETWPLIESDIEAPRASTKVAQYLRLMGVFMAAAGDFFDQPRVANAASDLFLDVFDSDRMPVRLVIGNCQPATVWADA
jgi:hypothetical protein